MKRKKSNGKKAQSRGVGIKRGFGFQSSFLETNFHAYRARNNMFRPLVKEERKRLGEGNYWRWPCRSAPSLALYTYLLVLAYADCFLCLFRKGIMQLFYLVRFSRMLHIQTLKRREERKERRKESGYWECEQWMKRGEEGERKVNRRWRENMVK